jgi:hypothetical protein
MRLNFLFLNGLLAACFIASTNPLRAATGARKPLVEAPDGWRVFFDPASSLLECVHPKTGTRLAGPLTFTVTSEGKARLWKIQAARDYAHQRLALVNEQDDVQGYVTISVGPARVELRAVHRPPQLYPGQLNYAPQVQFGAQAFACRTRVPEASPVVQMASGPADSQLNDSLFDPARDRVLCFGGPTIAITTPFASANQAPIFQANLNAAILRAEDAALSFEVIPDYYRSRYVPQYRQIDRKHCPSPPTGWMSWNVYFDTAGERENLDEARVGAQYLQPYGLEIWSIESWQDNSPKLPVSNFHNLTLRPSPEKFPHGMQWLAGQIRALGFRPGIWTVPWGTGDESYYRSHKPWFLHGPDGQPLSNWNGRFVLDPSQAEVRQLMEATHRVMSRDWGYEFFKIDGMSATGPGYSAHFFERPEVRAAFKKPVQEPYQPCLEALRRGIGPDRILLACQGHYTGPEVAWADAGRLGADIVEANHPPRWANYLNQARVTLSQLFVHNIVWYNDPDTLLVGAAPLNEARLATTVIALPGQLTFFGDKLGQLPGERMRLLQQALPVCDAHPLDLAPVNELKAVWDLKIRRRFGAWDVVSLFNWSEASRAVQLDFSSLGLDGGKEYLVFDFWNQAFLGIQRRSFTAPVAPHANLLLAIHERLDRPQFLATDRHVSQGGVELIEEHWNPVTGELTCQFKCVRNDPLTVTIHRPEGFRYLRARAEEAALEKVLNADSPAIKATLRRASSGAGALILTFEPTPAKK